MYNLGVDTTTYDALGRAIAAKGLSAIPPSQPPGFVSLVGLVYWVTGSSVAAVKATSCVELVLIAVLVFWLGRRAVGVVEGLVASSIVLLHPLMAAYAATVQYEILAALVATVAVAVWFKVGQRTPSLLGVAVLGLACAAAALVREVLVVLVPLTIAVAFSRPVRQQGMNVVARYVVVSLIAFSLPIGAWTLLQHHHSGSWVLLSQKSDLNLRLGNNPNATGTYHAQLSPILEPSGWAYIRQRPADDLRLIPHKVAFFWGIERDPWTVPQPLAPFIARMLGGVVPYEWCLAACRGGILLILFAVGTIVIAVRRPELWAIPASVLAVNCVHIVYFSSQRFAVPVLPLIALTAGIGLGAVFQWLTGRRAALWASLIFLAVAAVSGLRNVPVRLTVEGESLEGMSVENRADPLAVNSRTRFAEAAGAPRLAAYLPAEVFPLGVMVVRARVRVDGCATKSPDLPATILQLRYADGQRLLSHTFSIRDACGGGGYQWLSDIVVARRPVPLSMFVSTEPGLALNVDRIEIGAGFSELRQARRSLEITP